MSKGYVLYNPIAGNGEYVEYLDMLDVFFLDELRYTEINNISDYSSFLSGLEMDDFIVLCGGDGTLNRFVNDTEGIDIKNEILYYPVGSGNDFAHDLGKDKGCNPFEIIPHMKRLPQVTVNGKTYRFINGIGYGIDGYCCEIGDEMRKTSNKPINYTSIAIKGLLLHYKPMNARITVDGVMYTYENVWLAPTMNGRYYGGGMMPTPNQQRNNGELSVMVFRGKSRLKTLCIFPSIFKGTHIEHEEAVSVHKGEVITVEFDRPAALQIDGEVISNVRSYTASIYK